MMEIGYIESFLFILSPPGQPNLKQQRRKKTAIEHELDSCWTPLYKHIRGNKPSVTAQRSASSRKRKAIWHSVARSVPDGYFGIL